MQNEAGAGGYERICMKLLISESRHIALISGNKLIVIAKLPAEACAGMLQREESHDTIKRSKAAQV